MPFEIRKSGDRGSFDFGWLKTAHTFSFGDYHDPKHMGFRVLRVINEDFVSPGQGFATHAHRDMEIITYVISGALEHKDSMGNGSVIQAGDVQYMSAGSGVTHSEFNHSKSEDVHLFQIWIRPHQTGATPRYDQKHFAPSQKRDQFCLMASEKGESGSISIRQNARIFCAEISAQKSLPFKIEENRFAWVQVVKGNGKVNGQALQSSDGLSVNEVSSLDFQAGPDGLEVLIFDLP